MSIKSTFHFPEILEKHGIYRILIPTPFPVGGVNVYVIKRDKLKNKSNCSLFFLWLPSVKICYSVTVYLIFTVSPQLI